MAKQSVRVCMCVKLVNMYVCMNCFSTRVIAIGALL
jgi:hypothetical protein